MASNAAESEGLPPSSTQTPLSCIAASGEPSSRWESFRKIAPYLGQSFYILFITGMNDATLGIIIPSLQDFYGLTQYVVSIVFLSTTAGYFIAAFSNGYLIYYTSQAKTCWIGSLSFLIGLFVIAFAVPFPVMCCMMAFLGFGTALIQSSANVICGEMPHSTVVLNFSHACYGLGALIAPQVVAGIFSAQKQWNTAYMVVCGMAALNAISVPLILRNMVTRAEREKKSAGSNEGEKRVVLLDAIKRRVTIIGAVFLLLYVGAEVTMGNWGYTFLITARSSDIVAMARIMSGYWAGICAGRVFLGYWTLRFGEKRMIYFYHFIIIAMLFLFWFVPTVAVDAAALAIMGVAIGPIYPSTVALAAKIVPARLYPVIVGFIASWGSAGAALFPYIVGVLIALKGVRVMVPFCVAMLFLMLACWVFFPNATQAKRDAIEEQEEAQVTIELDDVTIPSTVGQGSIHSRNRVGLGVVSNGNNHVDHV
ncbi:major facilitator superfamily domain-containing protein [Dichotomocladium elegans]|nr:major facilitator superfamily domain-containing protein [Dichotomocladium elegans]